METKSNVTTITPEELIEQLRAIRAHIPEYVQLTTADALTLRRAANVSPQFLHASVNGVGASQPLQAALGRNPEELRQEEDALTRWSAVEDELRATLHGVMSANLTRRHRLGVTALQAYQISRQLVRQPGNHDLLPHVQEMRRLNTFGKRRKAAQPQVKAQPAQPPAEPKPVQ